MQAMKMPNWLMQRARLTPDRAAIESGDGTVTFNELYEQVAAVSRRLAAWGIGRGEHVALLCESTLSMIRFIHALGLLGAVSILLNNRLSTGELAWQTEDSAARLLISDRALEKQGREIAEKQSVPFATMDEIMAVRPEPVELSAETDLDAPCTMVYTSGTTGHPKGVILTWGNHWWSAAGSMLNLGLERTDKWLCCVPLFHVSGLSILMKSLIYGMTVVLQTKFNPHEVNLQILQNGVTMMSVVSNMLRRMLDDLGDEKYPASFRCMLLGGGPAPMPLLRRCEKNRIPIYQTYGLTETASQMVTLPPEFMFSKIGSAGKPLFHGEIRIDGREQTAPEQPGEILVRGPNVTSGYWGRPEATAQALKDGWLHTGDIGYLDQDGFLYVLDRRCDLIISGGENIYPAEIESVLLSHPAVEEAGVIGVKDVRWGEVPWAFVKPGTGFRLSEKELLDFCAGQLAHYKLPVHVQQVESLPRNASRKLLRRKLAGLLPENVRSKYDL